MNEHFVNFPACHRHWQVQKGDSDERALLSLSREGSYSYCTRTGARTCSGCHPQEDRTCRRPVYVVSMAFPWTCKNSRGVCAGLAGADSLRPLDPIGNGQGRDLERAATPDGALSLGHVRESSGSGLGVVAARMFD